MRLGTGQARRRGVASTCLVGVSYAPEAQAYFAAMTVQPSAARKDIINTCINALIAAGVWAKLDWLSLMAANRDRPRLTECCALLKMVWSNYE